MRFDGLVKNWNDDRGFGFIEPKQGGQELFVHIKAFPYSFGRPTVGAKVTFEVELGGDGKKRAIKVQPAASAQKSDKKWETPSVVALLVFVVSYLISTLMWNLPWQVGAAYVVMSLICAGFYWHDKVSARLREWRTSEAALFMLGVFCGWPGAIVAQQVLRHKTSKKSFRVMHWTSAVMNMVLFYLVSTPLLRTIPGG
jgi:uncharacterized membrane protein YsdA (DUF1294 family)/cold shock CspA family protein